MKATTKSKVLRILSNVELETQIAQAKTDLAAGKTVTGEEFMRFLRQFESLDEREKVAYSLSRHLLGVTDIQLGRELQSRLLNPEEPWKLLCQLERKGFVSRRESADFIPTWVSVR